MKGYINIKIILITLHLSVFLFPFAVKSLHHHDHTSEQYITHKGECNFEEPHHCVICDFEFIKAVEQEKALLSCNPYSILIRDFSLPQTVITASHISFTLRAPPAF